jgi:hypothetical protein
MTQDMIFENMLAFPHVHVGPTDITLDNFHQNFALLRLRQIKLFNLDLFDAGH